MNLVCVACEDTRGKGENTLNILQQCCTYQFDFSKNKISTLECFHLRKVKILVLTYYADSSCQVICFLWKVIFQTMTSRNMLGWNFFFWIFQLKMLKIESSILMIKEWPIEIKRSIFRLQLRLLSYFGCYECLLVQWRDTVPACTIMREWLINVANTCNGGAFSSFCVSQGQELCLASTSPTPLQRFGQTERGV